MGKVGKDRDSGSPSAVRKAATASSHAATRVAGSAVFSNRAWNMIARSLKLSGRELQIIRGMFDFQKEYSIAANLGISPHTVHTHIERLHDKLGIADRPQLLVLIVQQFLMLTATSGSALPPICPNRAAGHCPFLD